MKVVVSRAALREALALVSGAVGKNTTLPVLGSVALGADAEGKLTVQATNLEILVGLTIDASVQRPGDALVPHKLLTEIVGAAEGATVELLSDNGGLRVTVANSTAHLKGADSGDFPVYGEVGGGGRLFLRGEAVVQFVTALRQVTFACAREESRPVLTGVGMTVEAGSGRLVLVGADGFRMSIKTIVVDRDNAMAVLVPWKSMAFVQKVLQKVQPIQINLVTSTPEGQVRIDGTPAYIVAQTLAGRYPDYVSLLDQAGAGAIIADLGTLHDAVDVAATFSRADAHIVRIRLAESRDQVVVSGRSAEMGNGQVTVPVRVEGEPLGRLAFNGPYLLQALTAFPSGEVAMGTGKQEGDPTIWRLVGDESFVHVLMPMIVRDWSLEEDQPTDVGEDRDAEWKGDSS